MDKASLFLNQHEIAPSKVDMNVINDFFISEMKKGLAGAKSTLPMIPSWCSPQVEVKEGESVIVIDAGGTNFRTCLVTFDSALRPVITDFKKCRMPGSDKEVSATEFFSILASEIERLIDKSDRIGFCFSYAAEILPDHDGVPTLLSKEIQAKEILGKPLGKNLLSELARRNFDVSKKKVMILNDTVTTLLAAVASDPLAKYDGYVGFILGTGTNTAYIEKNSNIGKIAKTGVHFSEMQIINVESGCLDFSLGDIDRVFIAKTKDPNEYHFEKMISGAYLGPLSQAVIAKAVEEGVLSADFGKRFEEIKVLSTPEMSFFLEDSENREHELSRCVAGNASDSKALATIIDAFIGRAAKLTAANLAASILISDFGKDPSRPVLVNADGTTFYKTKNLMAYTQKYLSEFLASKGRYVAFTRLEDSPVLGSAIGAMGL